MNLINVTIIFVVDSTIEHDSVMKNFNKLLNIKLYKCDISQIKPVDCMVCPSNSYGVVTNKHSLIINKLLNMENGIKNAINNLYYGEQPVGTCMLMNINTNSYKYMAHLPITREPIKEQDSSITSKQSKQSSSTDKKNNVYYAFRALLTSVLNYNKVNKDKIKTISCPILYTDYNNKDSDLSTYQMRLAYSMVDINPDCDVKTADHITKLLK